MLGIDFFIHCIQILILIIIPSNIILLHDRTLTHNLPNLSTVFRNYFSLPIYYYCRVMGFARNRELAPPLPSFKQIFSRWFVDAIRRRCALAVIIMSSHLGLFQSRVKARKNDRRLHVIRRYLYNYTGWLFSTLFKHFDARNNVTSS